MSTFCWIGISHVSSPSAASVGVIRYATPATAGGRGGLSGGGGARLLGGGMPRRRHGFCGAGWGGFVRGSPRGARERGDDGRARHGNDRNQATHDIPPCDVFDTFRSVHWAPKFLRRNPPPRPWPGRRAFDGTRAGRHVEYPVDRSDLCAPVLPLEI